MKNVFVLLFLIPILISCEITGDLKYSEAIPGGCALNKRASLKSTRISDINKVSYTISRCNFPSGIFMLIVLV